MLQYKFRIVKVLIAYSCIQFFYTSKNFFDRAGIAITSRSSKSTKSHLHPSIFRAKDNNSSALARSWYMKRGVTYGTLVNESNQKFSGSNQREFVGSLFATSEVHVSRLLKLTALEF